MTPVLSIKHLSQDTVLAIDCRDFYDPQRVNERATALSGRVNHIGYHHSVFAGFLRGGALVYNQNSKKREEVPLPLWWQRFVLQPLWDKVMHFCDHLRAWEAQGGSDRGAKPRLCVVFFCKWGRHRSVGLHKVFVCICQRLKWLRISETSHLSSHSWRWVTCECCQAIQFCFDMKTAVGSATAIIFSHAVVFVVVTSIDMRRIKSN